MKLWKVYSLALLVVCAGPSAGNVQWRADYQKALDEAKRRNVPILIVLEKDGASSPAAVALAGTAPRPESERRCVGVRVACDC